MSQPKDSTTMAHSIYQATVNELTASHDPALRHDVMQQLGDMLRGGDQSAAQITSAVALTDAEKREIEAKLQAKFGRALSFAYTVDRSLLGGVMAKVGDKIIDGSLATKLNAMQESLLGAR